MIRVTRVKSFTHTQAFVILSLIMALCLLLALMASATALADDYQPPRLPNGQPDLQGTWTNVSMTTLTRPDQYTDLTLSSEQARRLEQTAAKRIERSLEPTDPNAPAPEKGNNVGGYNLFWTEPGQSLAMIEGEYRTSWIVDPKSGQLPYSQAGRQQFEKLRDRARQNTDGPEVRPMTERCIIGFGSTGGPPMLNVGYNSNYQIVQTDDAVMILVEMVHDARIIRLNDEHNTDLVPRWLGDSVGHWDGDTLVIETQNFTEGEGLRLYFDASYYISPQAKVTERITRISDTQLFYEFEVEDPEVYTQPWRGEMIFNATDKQIFEYACHEGNYALPNILGGARKEDGER